MLLAEGDFEDAFIGFADRPSLPRLAIYDKNKCIEILIKQGMTNEDAIDYFMFFEEDSWVGDNTAMIFYLKNRAGWQDKIEKETIVEHKQVIDLTRISDEELDNLERTLRRASTQSFPGEDEEIIEGVHKEIVVKRLSQAESFTTTGT
jgi:hypothetical protein